ncbi:MAG: lipo-releasing system ATP-binding protein LolD [Candidatus Xenolissoclinum pacificiensis L6]|uniref:Lipo-releasing system ATP-binding protein LolD n=1 Tax=Candidatus Xenolissoclinum pacificiensis L6 TaxID=1401685 RepID=W2V1G5_9RICK|nr:MAG: lipo-releasing system ATP-binding protein LolD [Candidatus Xenolissoclinum pacificiensis L6]
MIPRLNVKNLKKSFNNIYILNGIDLCVHQGQILAIQSISGGGKTTLLHTIGLLDDCNSGEIYIDGILCKKSKYSAIRRSKIGFVYQFHHLINNLSVYNNLYFAAKIKKLSDKVASDNINSILKEIGLYQYKNTKVKHLSGGEQQRIAVARAFINHPKLVIADEPTGSLDIKSANLVFSLLKNFTLLYGTSIIMSTHDVNLAKKCNKTIMIQNGKIVKHTAQ